MIESGLHDQLCPVHQGSCCSWIDDCACQCLCDFIHQIRVDEREQFGKQAQLAVASMNIRKGTYAYSRDLCLAWMDGWTTGRANQSPSESSSGSSHQDTMSRIANVHDATRTTNMSEPTTHLVTSMETPHLDGQ